MGPIGWGARARTWKPWVRATCDAISPLPNGRSRLPEGRSARQAPIRWPWMAKCRGSHGWRERPLLDESLLYSRCCADEAAHHLVPPEDLHHLEQPRRRGPPGESHADRLVDLQVPPPALHH